MIVYLDRSVSLFDQSRPPAKTRGRRFPPPRFILFLSSAPAKTIRLPASGLESGMAPAESAIPSRGWFWVVGGGPGRVVGAAVHAQGLPALERESPRDPAGPAVRGGVVVDHDHVEFEISALSEGALNGVKNCPLAIPNRYDDAGSYRKFFRCVGNLFAHRGQPGADSVAMLLTAFGLYRRAVGEPSSLPWTP